MSQYADIQGGVIVQIYADPGTGLVPCPHWAKTGDLWNGGDPLKPDGTPYSDDEKQVVFEDPLDVTNALTDGEVETLRLAVTSQTPSARSTVAFRLVLALGSTSRIRTASDQTRALVAAAVGYGFITAERARIVFQDPGVV